MQRIGEKIHTLRIYHNMTLKEVAIALGHTSHGYISEIESGKKKPTTELVLKIAKLFNITTDELLKDELDLLSIKPPSQQ